MGNSGSNLPFDIGAAIEYSGNAHWQLNSGYKKGEADKEEVSIFRFAKSQSDKLVVAQRAVQKLRTLKHPSVLGFIDSADMEDQLVLVTEPCVPLDSWVNDQLLIVKTGEERQLVFEEALWGFKCILSALSFLHSAGNMTHSYLGPHAIFICKSGDWKLGCMDLACNTTSSGDASVLLSYAHLLSTNYQAPERKVISSSALAFPQGSADIFSLAQIIIKVASDLQYKVPASTQKVLTRMTAGEPAKRPSAESLMTLPLFNSEHAQLLNSLGDLTIKPTAEVLVTLTGLVPKAAMIPRPVSIHKIIPALSRVLQMAVTDFANRDSREAARQTVEQAMVFIAELAKHNKLDEATFNAKCVPVLATLWPMPDRAIRTTLLKTSKYVMPLIPDAAFNKSMFDAMLAGFADSNAKMREETLKNLVYVVDKLDEKHLQDKLVRCITSLQGDAEASIRTNVTIFLGKIASKLKDATRARILCPSFQKAMRDNFMHCRVAGLKSTTACLQLLEPGQLSKTIMPQLCILLMDRHKEVRDLVIPLLESCIQVMQVELAKMAEQDKINRHARDNGAGDAGDSPMGPSSSSSSSSGTLNASGSTGSFLSWAVDGLAKGLEKAAIASAGQDAVGPPPVASPGMIGSRSGDRPSNTGAGVVGMKLDGNKPSIASASRSGVPPAKPATTATVTPTKPPSKATASHDNFDNDDWDIDADLDLGDEPTTPNPVAQDDAGWGDDDFDVDFDDDDEIDTSSSKKPPSSSSSSSSQLAASIGKPQPASTISREANHLGGTSSSSSGTLKIIEKEAKPVVQRTAWDDADDDMFAAVDMKVVEPKSKAKQGAAESQSTTTTATSSSATSSAAVSSSISASSISASALKPSSAMSLSLQRPSTTPSSTQSPARTPPLQASAALASSTSSAKSVGAKKPAVTKLAVDKSDWDDF